jgi:hypothetical protein
MRDRPATSPLVYARVAGVLYLAIIVCGIFGEVFVRSTLFVPGDAALTAERIVAAQGLFRLGFVADSLMVLSDVALAVLLYVLLRPASKTLALIAMCFRLTQSAVLALNLLNYHAALLLLNGGEPTAAFEAGQVQALAHLFLDSHRHGYDLGLLLFGVHCLVLGVLILGSRLLPRALGVLAIAASLAYLIGSYTRFLFPEFLAVVSPIYIVPLVSELSLALWLLVKGVDVGEWEKSSALLH